MTREARCGDFQFSADPATTTTNFTYMESGQRLALHESNTPSTSVQVTRQLLGVFLCIQGVRPVVTFSSSVGGDRVADNSVSIHIPTSVVGAGARYARVIIPPCRALPVQPRQLSPHRTCLPQLALAQSLSQSRAFFQHRGLSALSPRHPRAHPCFLVFSLSFP